MQSSRKQAHEGETVARQRKNRAAKAKRNLFRIVKLAFVTCSEDWICNAINIFCQSFYA